MKNSGNKIASRIFFICLMLLFSSSFAGWDKTGRYHIRDTFTTVHQKAMVDSIKNISSLELSLKQAGFGLLSGGAGIFIGGLIGGILTTSNDEFSGLGVIPGSILGYTVGNSLGVYLTAKYYHKEGNLLIITISETISAVIVIGGWALANHLAADRMNSEHYPFFSNNFLPVMGISLTFILPTVTGIVANRLTD